MTEVLSNPTNLKVIEFNEYFVKDQKHLLGFAKSINSTSDYQSLLQDCYIKAYTKIARDGFEGSNFKSWFKTILCNTYKTSYRNKRIYVDYDSIDHSCEIEDKLQIDLTDDYNTKELNDKATIINSAIFEYVNKFYSAKDQFIFKTYFLLKGKKLNYQQLSDVTGYSITSVSNKIKVIKQDLRYNIKTFIETGYNNMELQELTPKVEQLLTLNIEQHYNDYVAMYKLINGANYSGCACSKGRLRESIQTWYNKNKTI